MTASLGGCGGNDSQANPKPGAGQAVPVLTATVEKKSVPLRLRAVGNVETQSSVSIKSRVDGQIL
ncbi:MAG TPA: hypothetical protein VF104_00840, partial [Burkholderiales bacterium]